MSSTSRRCDVIQCLIIHLNNEINLFSLVTRFLHSCRTSELQSFNGESCACVCVWLACLLCGSAINKFEYVAISCIHFANHFGFYRRRQCRRCNRVTFDYIFSSLSLTSQPSPSLNDGVRKRECRTSRDFRTTMMCRILAFSTLNHIWNVLIL